MEMTFEARRRNELRVEIHLEPYDQMVKLIRLNPAQVGNDLSRMTNLVAGMRAFLLAASTSNAANKKQLVAPDSAMANITIVKYSSDLSQDPELEQTITFFESVVREITPLVDQHLVNNRY